MQKLTAKCRNLDKDLIKQNIFMEKTFSFVTEKCDGVYNFAILDMSVVEVF